MKTAKQMVLALMIGFAALFLATTGRAQIVYSNATTRTSPDLFAQSGYEFGDEIVLDGGQSAFITNFIFEYYGTNFSGNEQVRLRFYRNDGAAVTVDATNPGTMLYDSGFFSIPGTTASTLTFNDLGVPVTGDFTWTVEFVGIEGGEGAGLSLYNPATVGSNYNDYWERSGVDNGWSLRSSETTPIDFGAVAVAAPTVADSMAPIAIIRTPIAYLRTNAASIEVAGIARDNSAVALVLYKFGTNFYQPATSTNGNSNWTFVITMAPGTNTVMVKSLDRRGNESLVQTRKFFYSVLSPFTLVTNGSGSVISVVSGFGTPTNGASLEIGRGYTVVAKVAANNLFSNWVSAVDGLTNVAGTNVRFTFMMQTNLTLFANCITNRFIGAAGAYYGLFSDPLGVAHESAGFVKVAVTAGQGYTATLLVNGDGLGLAGKFDQGGNATATVIRRSGVSDVRPRLTLRMALDLNGGDVISGSVSNNEPGGWVSDLAADRMVWSALLNPPNSYTGRYTMAMPGSTVPAVQPAGDGWGTITVKPNGGINFVGTAGDNRGMTALLPPFISKNGAWPFYMRLYKYARAVTNPVAATITTWNGSMMGWLYVSNSSANIGGDLIWNKKFWTNGVYDAGFTNDWGQTILGSPYVVVPFGTRSLDISNGVVYVQDGNLVPSFTNDVKWATNNVITVTNVPNNNTQTFTFTKGTGKITSVFKHPNNGNLNAVITGVVLQNQAEARGVFRGTGLPQTGSMLLQNKQP